MPYPSCPDDGVGVMVGDDGDVLVALAVTGLIDADADEPVEAPRRIRLQIPKGSGDAAADGLPVDQEEIGDGGARKMRGEPSRGAVEGGSEAGIVIGPGNRGDDYAVLRV